TRLPTHEDDFVDLIGRDAGVFKRLPDRRDRLFDEVADELLELRPGQRDDEVLRTRLVGRDERKVDLGLLCGAELDLRLLGGLFEALESLTIVAQVDALVLFEL